MAFSERSWIYMTPTLGKSSLEKPAEKGKVIILTKIV
jgi:hypothetical protein